MKHPQATPTTSLSATDVYRILGAKHHRYGDPFYSLTREEYENPQLMRCDNCPLRLIERSGLYAHVCSIDHQGLLRKQRCNHGFGPNLEGATKNLFDRRDEERAKRPRYRCQPIGKPYRMGRDVIVEVDHSRDDLKDSLPDVDAWRDNTPQKIADALGVDVESVCARLDEVREENKRYADQPLLGRNWPQSDAN